MGTVGTQWRECSHAKNKDIEVKDDVNTIILYVDKESEHAIHK